MMFQNKKIMKMIIKITFMNYSSFLGKLFFYQFIILLFNKFINVNYSFINNI